MSGSQIRRKWIKDRIQYMTEALDLGQLKSLFDPLIVEKCSYLTKKEDLLSFILANFSKKELETFVEEKESKIVSISFENAIQYFNSEKNVIRFDTYVDQYKEVTVWFNQGSDHWSVVLRIFDDSRELIGKCYHPYNTWDRSVHLSYIAPGVPIYTHADFKDIQARHGICIHKWIAILITFKLGFFNTEGWRICRERFFFGIDKEYPLLITKLPNNMTELVENINITGLEAPWTKGFGDDAKTGLKRILAGLSLNQLPIVDKKFTNIDILRSGMPWMKSNGGDAKNLLKRLLISQFPDQLEIIERKFADIDISDSGTLLVKSNINDFEVEVLTHSIIRKLESVYDKRAKILLESLLNSLDLEQLKVINEGLKYARRLTTSRYYEFLASVVNSLSREKSEQLLKDKGSEIVSYSISNAINFLREFETACLISDPEETCWGYQGGKWNEVVRFGRALAFFSKSGVYPLALNPSSFHFTTYNTFATEVKIVKIKNDRVVTWWCSCGSRGFCIHCWAVSIIAFKFECFRTEDWKVCSLPVDFLERIADLKFDNILRTCRDTCGWPPTTMAIYGQSQYQWIYPKEYPKE